MGLPDTGVIFYFVSLKLFKICVKGGGEERKREKKSLGDVFYD